MPTGALVAKQPKGQNPTDGPDAPVGAEKKLSSLKVRPPVQRLVAKIATHRNMSIEGLFEEEDVQTFFKHLLLAEMKKEEQLLQGKPKR